MQLANSKIFNNRNIYRDKSEVKSGIEIVDPIFKDFITSQQEPKKLWTGCEWAEGPVFIEKENCILWSDVPNNRMLKYDIDSNNTFIYREPSNYSNGNTTDLEGNLITCEHQTHRITRTNEKNEVTILVDNYQGKRLNSPNDVVVKSDGTIWFTDPPYGILSEREGNKRESDLEGNFVFRFDPKSKIIEIAFDLCDRPNGLAFSPDESILYIADSGEPENIVAANLDIEGSKIISSKIFTEVKPGIADGFRLDTLGNIWTSAWDGIHCYSSEANLLGKIFIPEQRTANLTFAEKDLSTMYIAGDTSLYSIKLNVNGCRNN